MSAHASVATAPPRPRLWQTADELRAAWSNGELLEVAPFVPRPERIHRLDLGQTGRGDTHLSTLIRHWFKHRLDEASCDRLASFCREAKRLDFGCACSGSGCLTLCAAALQDGINELIGAQFECTHKFAVENNPEKQNFLKVMFPLLPKLFEDVTVVSSGAGMNKMASPAATASVDEVDVFGAGFPCQDASALHSDRASSSHRSCVIEASLRTGSVVRHIFALVGQMRRARLLLLENVAGLAAVPRDQNHQPIGPSNLAAVIFCAAKEAGFHIRAFSLNPYDFGVPQCRHRLWMVGVPMETLRAAGMNCADADRLLEGFMCSLVGCEESNGLR